MTVTEQERTCSGPAGVPPAQQPSFWQGVKANLWLDESYDLMWEPSIDFGGLKVAYQKLFKTKVSFVLYLYIHGGVYRGWLM